MTVVAVGTTVRINAGFMPRGAVPGVIGTVEGVTEGGNLIVRFNKRVSVMVPPRFCTPCRVPLTPMVHPTHNRKENISERSG